jgi:superfamily I DNA and/or RNA helicase
MRKLNVVYTDNATAHTEIGVIAPYHAQCVKIRKALSGVADEVKVGSVEEFQGQVSGFQSAHRSGANLSN